MMINIRCKVQRQKRKHLLYYKFKRDYMQNTWYFKNTTSNIIYIYIYIYIN